MHRPFYLPWLLIILALAAACDGPPGSAPEPPAVAPSVTPVDNPVTGPAGEPNLAAGPDGLYMSWLEETGPDVHTLRVARWNGREWDEVRTVVERSGMFVNWADFPAVAALDDGRLLAHWLEKSGPAPYAYDVRMRVSDDHGRSWSDDLIPHDDGTQTEHGFVSLMPLGDRFAAVWLDGRETPDGQPMTLRFATVAPDGSVGEDALLDASTCDCCQTAMAAAGDTLLVAYRDRTEVEVRDVHMIRRIDGRWTDGRPLHRDGWVIDACPVNGPAMDARGQRVAVAWFTAAEPADEAGGPEKDPKRSLLAFSDDGGGTFTAPIRFDDGGSMGRVDVLLLDDGSALVSWLERAAGGAELRVRRVVESGPGRAARVAGVAAMRASGFPRMARLGDGALIAWTATGQDGSRTVRTAVIGTARDDGTEEGQP